MKVLIVYRIFQDDEKTKGIFKKQEAIARAFRRQNHDCDLLFLTKEGIHLNDKMIKKMNFASPVSKPWNLYFNFFTNLSSVLHRDYDLVYVRYSPVSRGLEVFAKSIRDNFPKTTLLLDFPTYPFIEEYQGSRRVLAMSGLTRLGHFRELFDGATVLDSSDEIAGIPCLRIENGVDLEEVGLLSRKTSPVFTIVFVGNLTPSQGLERVIHGLLQYNSKTSMRQVSLKVIGDGSERRRLQELAKPLGSCIEFTGNLYNDNLVNALKEASIAVGNLGMHRINFDYSSGLKHREYCARGIPFFYSCKDRSFDHCDFICKFSADETPIAIQNVMAFVDQLATSGQEMRSYAEEFLSWDRQVKKILSFIGQK